ncbi:unnamed protein product [Heterobilharzia americana]|nr:unnamed protein product [Heterobilharzia americana]
MLPSRVRSVNSKLEIITIILTLIYGVIILPVYTKTLDIESDTPLTISFIPPSDQVLLNEPLIIRCEVNTLNSERSDSNKNILSGYSMFFLCPIAPWGKFCFHNCQSACVGENPGKCPYEKELGLVKCRTVVTQQGHIFYEYTIPSLTNAWLGSDNLNINNNAANGYQRIEGFSCKTAGLKTPQIPLILARPTETTITTLMSHIPITTKKTKAPATRSPTVLLSVNNGVNKSSSEEKTNRRINGDSSNQLTQQDVSQSITTISGDLKAALTREVLIIGAIIFVFISLIVNVFCCIRCALIRQYSKTKDRVHMQHLFCMAEEIRNARIVKQINGKGRGYRDKLEKNQSQEQRLQQQQQQIRLANLLHDGNTTAAGSSLLMMNKLQPQPNGYESYQPSIDYGSEYVTGLNYPGMAFSDNQSSGLPADIHLRYLPDGKSGNRQSISAFSLVPGQLPMTWTNNNNNSNESHRRSISSVQRMGTNSLASHSSQQQIAAAVTNFYLQHQQHFMELQNHLNNNTETGIVNQLGSDGMGSCFGSIGQPDSSILSETNIIPSNSGGQDSGHCESVITENLVNHSPMINTRNINNTTNNNSSSIF